MQSTNEAHVSKDNYISFAASFALNEQPHCQERCLIICSVALKGTSAQMCWKGEAAYA